MNRSSIFGNFAWCVYYVCMGAAYGFTPGLERVWIALDSEVSLRLKSALPQARVTATHINSPIFQFCFQVFSNFVRGQFSFCKCGPRESRLGCQQKNLISVKVCKYLQAPSGLDPSRNDATLMTRALITKKNFWKTTSDILRTFAKLVQFHKMYPIYCC